MGSSSRAISASKGATPTPAKSPPALSPSSRPVPRPITRSRATSTDARPRAIRGPLRARGAYGSAPPPSAGAVTAATPRTARTGRPCPRCEASHDYLGTSEERTPSERGPRPAGPPKTTSARRARTPSSLENRSGRELLLKQPSLAPRHLAPLPDELQEHLLQKERL